MTADDQEPFEVEALRTENETDSIKLIFENADGEHRAVNLRRSRIPGLISLLQTKIEVGSVTPINRDSLFVGQSFALER
jgi:hypothetical protein